MNGQAYDPYGEDPNNLSLDMTDSELKRKKTEGMGKSNGSEEGANGVKRNKRYDIKLKMTGTDFGIIFLCKYYSLFNILQKISA